MNEHQEFKDYVLGLLVVSRVMLPFKVLQASNAQFLECTARANVIKKMLKTHNLKNEDDFNLCGILTVFQDMDKKQ